MRMQKIRFILSAILIGAIAACSTTRNSAPVIDRVSSMKATEGKPATIAGKVPDNGYYTVKKGDTLLHIALDFGQNYRDIVAWNNLANPNDIKIDQVLRVLPPDSGSVAAQSTGVSTVSGIETRPLTAPVASAIGNKTGPRADKRPYSESALEELQKQDVAVATTGAKDVARTAVDKPLVMSVVPAVTAVEDPVISWMWPAEGKVVEGFDGGKNKGIDIAGKLGQPVVAAGAGKVIYAGSDIRGYGNLVILRHTDNLSSAYAHNKTITVKEGQSVNKGEVIAEMGNSDSDAVKLHFQIRQQGKPVDPSKFLPNR